MSGVRTLMTIIGLIAALDVSAHPLGNNTVNRQTTISLTPTAIELRYLMDLAEIPTLIASGQADQNGDGGVSEAEWRVYAQRWATALPEHLALEVNGQALALRLQSHQWKLLPGEAGLQTLWLDARYTTPFVAAQPTVRLTFRDRYQADNAGWKEIWMRAQEGVQVAQATVPFIDRSRALTDFTLPAGAAPPNELDASAELAVSRGTLAAAKATAPQTTAPDAATLQPAPGMPFQPVRGWGQALDFFRLGMHHIATGWDHLVFVFGLILLTTSMRELVKIVTAFTVAHSATLALAATGLLVPPSTLVEPAIALTLVYVGWQSLRGQGGGHGVWLALGFGLVHGFGFAGALAQTLSGGIAPMSSQGLINLASFNLGIEVFQVVLVVMLVPLVRVVARASWSNGAHRAASAAVIMAGTVWFADRVLPALA